MELKGYINVENNTLSNPLYSDIVTNANPASSNSQKQLSASNGAFCPLFYIILHYITLCYIFFYYF